MYEQGNPEQEESQLHCATCELETRHVVNDDGAWKCAAALHGQRIEEKRARSVVLEVGDPVVQDDGYGGRQTVGKVVSHEACPPPASDEATEDVIRKPSHYTKRGIEVRQVIAAFGCNYNVGTAVAYLLRAPFKGTYQQDIRKAAQHLAFEIESWA